MRRNVRTNWIWVKIEMKTNRIRFDEEEWVNWPIDEANLIFVKRRAEIGEREKEKEEEEEENPNRHGYGDLRIWRVREWGRGSSIDN